MANHRNAEKAHRQSLKRNERNRARRTLVKVAIKNLNAALATGDKAATTEALRNAQSHLAKAVSKGVILKQTAARRISRLNTKVKKAAA